jgi:APA family basic amino acid/polyamine antiporter
MSQAEPPEPLLRRSLGRWHLTMLGVSNAVGSGVLVLSGTMASTYAGPAASISFAIAGVVCLIVALCYAELAAMMPDAGSAYSYARRSTNRLVAWLVGWCLVMGYLVAGATVAVGWSGYCASLIADAGVRLSPALLAPPITIGADFVLAPSGGIVNLPAMACVALCTLFLLRGVRESATFNMLMVGLKLGAVLLFVTFGIAHVDPGNWSPFVPPAEGTGRFGIGGILAGAVLAFFAYTGFEVISTSTEEARNPGRDIPFALLASFWICAMLYIAVTLVMTGMVPFRLLDHPSPLVFAIEYDAPGSHGIAFAVTTLIVLGLPSAVLVSLYGQTRIFVTMSNDGLLPPLFGHIHPAYRTPFAGTLVVGLAATIVAGLLPIEVLGELVSMGLLFCFAVVCLAVIILRRREPEAERPFRLPGYPWTPAAGVVACLYLIATLPVATWSRLVIWIAIGLAIYAVYGARRSRRV